MTLLQIKLIYFYKTFILTILTFQYSITAPFKNTQQTQVVDLKNDSNSAIAFKVKTTAPKSYCVRPNSGVLKSNEQIQITIIFQGLSEEPQLGSKCKDKFLFVSVPCNEILDHKDVSSKWSELEAQNGGVSSDIKVKVVYDFGTMNTIAEKREEEIEQPVIENNIQRETLPVEKSIPVQDNKEIPQQQQQQLHSKEIIEENEIKPTITKTTPIAPPTSVPGKTSTSSNDTLFYIIALILIIIAFLISRIL